MLYNTKYRLWSKVNKWWDRFKPVCNHWFKVVSSVHNGRKEIEVSECRWCDSLTSELYIKGEKFDKHFETIKGYGPVEACPVTEDPLVETKTGPVIILKNKELYFERHSDMVSTDRDSRKSPKATRPRRQSIKSRTRSKRRS